MLKLILELEVHLDDLRPLPFGGVVFHRDHHTQREVASGLFLDIVVDKVSKAQAVTKWKGRRKVRGPIGGHPRVPPSFQVLALDWEADGEFSRRRGITEERGGPGEGRLLACVEEGRDGLDLGTPGGEHGARDLHQDDRLIAVCNGGVDGEHRVVVHSPVVSIQLGPTDHNAHVSARRFVRHHHAQLFAAVPNAISWRDVIICRDMLLPRA
mmetsp:Transcript_114061/g.333380  ORF Transcript_114061/g.333380 Transcript_114061/m.333380 type:complete len:211 (-) Transcript_114061:1306-1938(-)